MINRPLAGVLAAVIFAAAVPLVAQATQAFPNAARAGPPKFDDADSLADAVSGAHRSAENVARDKWRHPHESLTFWGVQPGDVIVELTPSPGYWTEILAPFAKATGGRYIAAIQDVDNPNASEQQKRARAAFEARFADQSVWGKVETVGFGKASGPLTAPGTADFVLSGRNIHNFIYQGVLDTVMADAFTALKPGGVLAIEEHRSDPRPMAEGARDGYVSEAYVIAAAEKAGFRLDAKSEINANPRDPKDHPFGVWTLPPTRRSSPFGQPPNPNFDHSRFDAIGESDCMTLRFRKPG